MDQARHIAYGKRRYRVVTLDGNVIETFGTMSGGGNRVARGAMSSKQSFGDATPEAVAKYTSTREAAELDHNDHQGTLRSMQAKHKSLQTRYDELDALLPKLELELKSVDEQVQMAKKRARDLSTTQDQPSESEMEQRGKVEKRISQEQGSIAELQEQCVNIETAIKELQEKIMQAGGIRLRAQKSKVDGLLERISTVRDEVSRWEVLQSKSRKELARVERSNAGRDAQINDLQSQLEEVTKEIDTKSMSAIEIKNRSDIARGQLETKRDELDRIKEQLDVKMEEYNEMRTKEAALKRKLDDIERALAEGTRGVNYWNSEMGHLALHSMEIDGIDMLKQLEGVDTSKGDSDDASDDDAMAVDNEENANSRKGELPTLAPAELENVDASSLETRIEQAEARLQRTRPNLSVLTEYVRRAREHRKRMDDLNEITTQRDSAQHELDSLRTQRLEEFMTGFNIISYKLKE
ncbi:Structural maintenance of chromosomes protein 4, partial [Coemansia erecta]